MLFSLTFTHNLIIYVATYFSLYKHFEIVEQLRHIFELLLQNWVRYLVLNLIHPGNRYTLYLLPRFQSYQQMCKDKIGK